MNKKTNTIKMEPASVNLDFYATSVDEAVTLLNSNLNQGLSEEEAKERFGHFGPNAIAEAKSITSFEILVNQFKSPIVFLLLFAAALSFWFKEWLDGIAIIIVLFINAAIGFYMEINARKSMLALKNLSYVPAKVLRNKKLSEINSENIVPGDILFVEAGDMITADGRICQSTQLLIDESALTGESVPVEKNIVVLPAQTVLADRVNMAFKGTFVAKGNAYILVSATGKQTELGKIATMIYTSEQAATPLERKLEDFSKKLIKITVALVVIIFIAGLINGQHVIKMLETAVALAVAAIPEGLPIVATMCLAQGMLKMSRYNVIVKKLSAVETLGGTNVICTDKTGTLTQNKMKVVCVNTFSGTFKDNMSFPSKGTALNLIFNGAVLCNTADIQLPGVDGKEIGDPLEIALLKFAQDNGKDINKIRNEFPKKGEEPFSSETKLMATLHEHDGKFLVFAKGAAEELLLKCTMIFEDEIVPLNSLKKDHWMSIVEEFAASGHRMIAMAYRETAKVPLLLYDNLVLLGFVGMIDPPRPEVFSAINDCKTAGIKVVMITGDHPSTAHYIGAQLGVSKEGEVPVIGKDMKDYENLTEDDKQHWINTSVFARVNPKHKLDLVKVFQEKGYVVGMTGDGVNDAPALKKSDIGISMGLRGTQVAQEVSDMVLKDDSFSSIVIAIKQGRAIFENIRKFVTFLLSCNLSELVVIASAAVMNLHFQLLPLQILFINLITDVLPALALGVTKASSEIMQLPPRKSTEPIINNDRWKLIFFYASVIAVASLSAVFINHYAYHKGEPWDIVMCNNILFFTIIFSQLFHVFNMGTGHFFNNEVIKNKYVWYSLIISILIVIVMIQITYVREALNIIPMTITEWTLILSASVSSVMIIQLGKRSKLFQKYK
ncbi:cation-translocating P-type ATPase [Pedobacter immunditicola]|uniref:cation-translocating P-type ATPase n=1 Tax=Pedobacter immunditicola TaxID=3133440 RepID=UPI0030B03E20